MWTELVRIKSAFILFFFHILSYFFLLNTASGADACISWPSYIHARIWFTADMIYIRYATHWQDTRRCLAHWVKTKIEDSRECTLYSVEQYTVPIRLGKASPARY